MDSDAINLTPQDLDLMARTIATEDNTAGGRAAVASVMMNRLRSGEYPNSMSGVVLQRNAFEPVGSARWRSLSPSSPDYQAAYKIAQDAASGSTADPTNGAVLFYSPTSQAALGRSMPQWAVGRAPETMINGQAYYTSANAPKKVADASFLKDFEVAPSGATAAASKPAPDDFLRDFEVAPASAPAQGQTPATVAPTPANAPSFQKDYPIAPGAGVPITSPSGKFQGDTPEFLLTPRGAGPSNLPPAFDPTAPVSTQIGTAANELLGYGKQQALGVPGAIAEDWNAASALNARGNQQMAAGENWPNFPSIDPKTWGAGGVLNSLAGMAGQISSPITGTIRKFVQEPVTEATGSPQIGENAGLVANTLAGPMVGRLGGNALSRAANVSVGTLDPETAQLAQLARGKWGIPVNAGQMAEAPGIRIASSALNRLPFSGAGADLANQQSAWLRGVASTIGESADKLTPDVMNAARKRIGSYYDTVAQNTTLNADPQFWQDVHDTLNDANLVLPKPEADILIKQAQNIISKVDPNTKTISGQTYQALTDTGTPLDKLTESSNPNLADYGNRLKKALDGALSRSATPQAQDLLKTADRQWAALKTIQPLAAKSPTGEISPALLTSRVNQATGNGMAFGFGGDLGELARIGGRFLKEPGSSNTAERALTYGALGGAVEAAGHALTGSMTPGELAIAAGTLPATLALGRGLGSAVRSNWLANALLNRSLQRIAAPPSSGLPLAAVTGLGGLGALNKPVNALTAPNQ